MSMAVEPDSAGVRFPPPFVYLGALLLGLAAERFVTLRSFGIDWGHSVGRQINNAKAERKRTMPLLA
jgi:hypothetical protein